MHDHGEKDETGNYILRVVGKGTVGESQARDGIQRSYDVT
jgi:hypothetical protein